MKPVVDEESAMDFMACCPVCQRRMCADTASGEEFTCTACGAMLDILDEDLCMLSLAPHDDVCFIPTADLLWAAVELVR